MKMTFPNNVNQCVQMLEAHGYCAYAVGGCVRDAIMNIEINDFDITTSALPETVMGLFEKTVPTGIKHGTITVLMDKKPVEVTTYRIDGEYKDNRRPETVAFTADIKEDLKRRDFTINAMAYNEQAGLLDETFFMYGEDIDLCFRIKEGGYRVLYYPKERIIHYKGGSSKKRRHKVIYDFHEAMWIFYKKHYYKRYNLLVTGLVGMGIWAKCGLELIKNATIENMCFYTVWEQAELVYLY